MEVKTVVDLGAPPKNINWLSAERHIPGAKNFEWDPAKVQFWLSPNQEGDNTVRGHELREELEAQEGVLNANLLDYLLENPNLIPEYWKKDGAGETRYIFFWGTIYRSSNGSLYVRCLHWQGDECWLCDWFDDDFKCSRWGFDGGWLSNDWGRRGPALVLAS